MKSVLLILSVLVSAQITSAKSLSCSLQEKYKNTEYGFSKLNLTADDVFSEALNNVTAQVQFLEYTGQQVLVVGRSKQIIKDENYNPIKYKGYSRFDLSKATDVKDFGRFLPSDQCRLLVMIPENVEQLKSLVVPVTVNCDQSGAKVELDCVVR